MASAARSGTSTLGLTSILPPRCMANTGSSSSEEGKREKTASSATVNPQELCAAGDRSAAVRPGCGGGLARRHGLTDGDQSRYGGCPLGYCAMSGWRLASPAPFCNTHDRDQTITELSPPQRGFARGPVILC